MCISLPFVRTPTRTADALPCFAEFVTASKLRRSLEMNGEDCRQRFGDGERNLDIELRCKDEETSLQQFRSDGNRKNRTSTDLLANARANRILDPPRRPLGKLDMVSCAGV